ncbi:MAG: chloramphenicol phosphotransferase [Mesorhizobium sp.]
MSEVHRNRAARIVLLNGVGSSGKSSIARALQSMTTEPFLHVAMDGFLDMLPPAYVGRADGVSFENVGTDDLPEIAIGLGPVGERLIRGMRQAVLALAREGNDLILDDVLLSADKADYIDALSAYDLFVVEVSAPLDVLERREALRGDRRPGLARWQESRVHEDMRYDLRVRTDLMSADECARLIKRKFNL